MKSREGELLFLYLTFDLIILNIALAILFPLNGVIHQLNFEEQTSYVLHANLSWIITYFIFTKKNLFLRDGYHNRVIRITKRSMIYLVVGLLLAYFFMPRTTFSRIFLFEYTGLFYIGKLIFYYFLYHYLEFLRKKGLHIKRAMIVGVNETGDVLRKMFECNPMLGYKFIGFVDVEDKEGVKFLGKSNQLEQLIKDHNIEIVFLTISLFEQSGDNQKLLDICNKLGIRLRFVPVHQHWFKNRLNLESVGQMVVINPQEIPLDDIEAQFFKRLFDILFSVLVLVFILSWLVPIIGLVIKLSSKGPVFFVQKRTGINNREFNCLKFRSMQQNTHADSLQATGNDARITAIGRFLRKSNLDELPQFFNVLVGKMSVVGPRPHMLKHTDEYTSLIDSYLTRHYVKPGITGWAQVNGYRGETDELWKMQKRVDYDMDYLRNWNFAMDLKIIALTMVGSKAWNNAG